jgi:hypothetical protein
MKLIALPQKDGMACFDPTVGCCFKIIVKIRGKFFPLSNKVPHHVENCPSEKFDIPGSLAAEELYFDLDCISKLFTSCVAAFHLQQTFSDILFMYAKL